MNRRRVLGKIGVVLPFGLAGCLAERPAGSDQTPSDSPTQTGNSVSIQTPPENKCEPNPEVRVTPDSPRAKKYPTHPDSLSASAIKEFGKSLERVHQFNSLLPEYETIGVNLTVPDWTVSETKEGYQLAVKGRVSFSNTDYTTESSTDDPTATSQPLPSGTDDVVVWYYITERFALRGKQMNELEKGDTPDLTNADTISCGSSNS